MIGTVHTGLHRVEQSRRFPWRPLSLLVGCIAFLCCLPAGATDSATVSFSLDFPGSDPEHYSISVQSDGRARYESSALISKNSDDHENYQTEFTLSDPTRARVFDLAAKAHFFSGKIDSSKKLANTGAKKLAYKDAQRESSAVYNFSTLPAVQQLTTLFQSVSATLEFGRRLAYLHRYQKLALDEELKHMEEHARQGDLIEMQAVKQVLEEIYSDSSVINVVRARAQRIIAMGPGATARR